MKNILCALLMATAMHAPAQILPDSITVDWTNAGFEGDIPEYTNVQDVTMYGAIAGDLIDDQPAVAAAISALSGNAGVIYFPPGNYLMNSTIILPDSTVIRGAGADSTLLSFDFGNASANSFNISGGVAGPFSPVASGLTKGSFELIISGADSLFAAGDEIEIRQENGAWDTNPASWADYSVGHLSKVSAINGDTLWLEEALRMDFDMLLSPEIRKINVRKFSGLECFKMVRIDSTATGINFGVNFAYAKNCWMKGVESEKSICSHVSIETSSHISISGCYFHHSYLYDGASTHGYGVVIYAHACSNKIEDNIFRMLRHAMIAKQGANGNVFGYNYSRETNRSEAISDYASDICMHGHYAFANLFEGNIVQNLQVDQAWGPSGPFNTFFRNKVENYGILMSSGTVQSDRQNFVGNDVSNMSLFHGLYSLAGVGHFEYGNNVRGTITPSGTNVLPDVTYYLDTIPPIFWNIAAPLPSIGIPNTFASDINPALQRYNDGGLLTVCDYEPDTNITTNTLAAQVPSLGGVKCFSNDGKITATVVSDKQEEIKFELFTVTGQRLILEKIKLQKGENNFSIAVPGIATGLYFFQITNNEIHFGEKIYIQ